MENELLGVQGKAKIISKKEAMKLANDYLKSRQIAWGEAISVAVLHKSGSIFVEAQDGQMQEETWDDCYYVQYKTDKKERELTGIRTVCVTRDGSKIAIPNSD
jgi:hypothetical protein